MERKRVRIVLEVDLDPVPGWGHDAQDYVRLVEREIASRVPHYNPTVTVEAVAS